MRSGIAFSPEKYPFRLLPLVAATFPKGTAFGDSGKVSGASSKASPWGAGEHSEPEGVAFGMAGKFPAKSQSLWTCLLPLGGAVAQRLRGFESAEPEKTVKRSSRRTGVNLQFFPVQPSALGLKGASSPFFVAPARRNRWHFSGSLLVSKENIPRLYPPAPPERISNHPALNKTGCRTFCAAAGQCFI